MFNTSRPKQNGRYFADYTLKYIFLNEKVIISAKISLKFVPKGPIYNIPVLFQIMAWRRPVDKPLSEPMMVKLSTHICVTRPQWVNGISICVQQPHQSYSRQQHGHDGGVRCDRGGGGGDRIGGCTGSDYTGETSTAAGAGWSVCLAIWWLRLSVAKT